MHFYLAKYHWKFQGLGKCFEISQKRIELKNVL